MGEEGESGLKTEVESRGRRLEELEKIYTEGVLDLSHSMRRGFASSTPGSDGVAVIAPGSHGEEGESGLKTEVESRVRRLEELVKTYTEGVLDLSHSKRRGFASSTP